jgi:hypothetical protein
MLGAAQTAWKSRAWAAAPGPAGDPYWDDVVMLLTARDNVLEDASTLDEGITVRQGSVTYPNTTQTKYNSYSIFCPTSAARFEVDSNATRDCDVVFTFEFWMRCDGTTPTTTFACPMGPNSSQGNNSVYFVNGSNQSGRPRFEFTESYISYNVHGSTMWDNQWHHIAMVRNTDNIIRFYYDGVESATTRSSTTTLHFGTAPWLIGGYRNLAGDNIWSGWIDDIRLTKGVARYTTGFTPPAEAFPIG